MTMLIEDILRHKGRRVISIAPHSELAVAVEIMTREQVGALVVLDDADRLLGIVSERDIVRATATAGKLALSLPVQGVMTRGSPDADPRDTVADAMRVMTASRTRHLPVTYGGRVVGLVSIGDVVKSRLQEKIEENAVLQDMARARLAAA
ncbi:MULTISPECIES: CBS domain-containing protein [unclassified Sphingomonas]|uniref:CBS domain-containing protein n=1 Tax=Sphingomonas TaxID=13687 RepID=UPI0025806146|nr:MULTISPECIES: CBS domain-containing protein [unclassified Sphingomonas]